MTTCTTARTFYRYYIDSIDIDACASGHGYAIRGLHNF